MAKIDHVDMEALIPAEERAEVFEDVIKSSKILPLMTRLANISTNKERIKVLDSLPMAYWLAGNDDFKKTTKLTWKDKYLYAEELQCIVPISINDLEDANYDIWGSVRPRIVEAMQKAVDEAILFGTNAPSSFPDSVLEMAFNRGHQVVQGVSETFYSVIDRAMEKVELDNYAPTGIVGGLGLRSAFRKMLDTTGQLIVGSEINEMPKFYVDNGSWDNSKAKLIVGDFSKFVYAIRSDVKFDLLTEASIYDPSSKALVYALAQQDMVALRCVFRLGVAFPDAQNPEEDRLPFAVVVPSANKIVVSATDEATFEESIDVELSSNVKGAKIYYTDNGDAPDATKTLYTAPITLSATKTIKAIAVADDYANSDVVSKTYTKAN